MNDITQAPLNKKITGGEVFYIQWLDTNEKTLNVVLPMNKEYYFVEFGRYSYWRKYETFIEELQQKEDLTDYLEFIAVSEDITIDFLGKMDDSSTHQAMLEVMESNQNIDWRKDKETPVAKAIREFVSTINTIYSVQKKIHALPLLSGDILHSFSEDSKLINKEILTRVEHGYTLLPVERKVSYNLEEETMTKQELHEYLFCLIVEEKLTISWQSPMCSATNKICLILEDNVNA